MKSKKQAVQKIEALARLFTPPSGSLRTARAKPAPGKGQLWTTMASPVFPRSLAASCAAAEPLMVVILAAEIARVKGHTLHLVAPIIDSAMAGPEDVLLDRNVLGHRAAVAAGSAVTVLHDSLDRCRGVLPGRLQARLTAFQRFLDCLSGCRPEVTTGLPYLDEKDVRFVYNEELADRMAYLQEPVVAWAMEGGAAAPARSPARTVFDAWKRVKTWCRQAGEAASWNPLPASVAAARADERIMVPVIRVAGNGEREVLAQAEESIPLPHPGASWRVVPAVAALAGKRFAVMSACDAKPVGYGRVNDAGARLALDVEPSAAPPKNPVILILDD